MEVGEMLLKTASDANATFPRMAPVLQASAGPQWTVDVPQLQISISFLEAKSSLMKTMKWNMNTFTLLLKLLCGTWTSGECSQPFWKMSRVARYLHLWNRTGASPFQEISQGAFDLLLKVWTVSLSLYSYVHKWVDSNKSKLIGPVAITSLDRVLPAMASSLFTWTLITSWGNTALRQVVMETPRHDPGNPDQNRTTGN